MGGVEFEIIDHYKIYFAHKVEIALFYVQSISAGQNNGNVYH